MPCILKIRVLGARDLPVMDKKTENTDAYVEIRFASHEALRTTIQKQTLNPLWNEDFRIECSDDAEVQDEVVEFRVLDYDSFTANDSVGSVYVDLSPLITLENGKEESTTSPNGDQEQISGWFPIYDTLRGCRGQLNLLIKLEYFGDENPFKHSSAGVLIFSGGYIPEGYRIERTMDLVSAILVEDDPEYHWSDSFRAPKFSNEARQKLLYRMSGQLRRQIGREVLELDGNAILGYKQYFDFENEESVITARAIGTAVKLTLLSETVDDDSDAEVPSAEDVLSSQASAAVSTSAPVSSVEEGFQNLTLKRQNTITTSSTDVILMTVKHLPHGCIQNIGGLVSARSVKLFANEDADEDEEDLRDSWWDELREEVQKHAQSMGCQFVLNYEETVSICDELVVLSAVGTAVNLVLIPYEEKELMRGSTPVSKKSVVSHGCQACHVPYTRKKAPFQVTLNRCQVCKRQNVPEILLTNIDPPQELLTRGDDIYLEAHVCRTKKRKDGESNASAVSDTLPFIEYDLHRQLVYKLRILGLNAIFGLNIKLCIGETLIVAVASGTASYLSALPPPPPLKISRSLDVVNAEDASLLKLQAEIMRFSEFNRKRLESQEVMDVISEDATLTPVSKRNRKISKEYHAQLVSGQPSLMSSDSDSESSSSSDSVQKQTMNIVVQIDDDTDVDLLTILLDKFSTDQLKYVRCNTSRFRSTDPDIQHLSEYIATGARKEGFVYHSQSVTLLKQLQVTLTEHRENRELSELLQNAHSEIRGQMLSIYDACVASAIEVDLYVDPNTAKEDNALHIRVSCQVTGCIKVSTPVMPLSYSLGQPKNILITPHKTVNGYCVTGHIDRISFFFINEDMNIHLRGQTCFGRHYLNSVQTAGAGRKDSQRTISGLPMRRLLSQASSVLQSASAASSPSVAIIDGGRELDTNVYLNALMEDIYAVVKAHTESLGGDAICSFKTEVCSIRTNGGGNRFRVYSVISVSGDAVTIEGEQQPNIIDQIWQGV